jgi:hypothetical protein
MGATDSKLAFRKGVFRLFEESVRKDAALLVFHFDIYMLIMGNYSTIESTRQCR